MLQVLTVSPLVAFMLEGMTYEWNALAWGGCVVTLLLAARWNNMLAFHKAHECYEVAVNRNMTKYQFLVYNNFYAKLWENALLKVKNKTYEQHFLEKLNNGTLMLPQEQI